MKVCFCIKQTNSRFALKILSIPVQGKKMENKIVRIKDIAEKANVSTGTVDRVLHKRGRVAADVEERVLRIIKEMKYEPNYGARALGANKTYTIAALVPDYTYDPYWYDPKKGIDKAERELKQYGVIVKQFQFIPDSRDSFIDCANEINSLKPDGVLLAPLFYKESLPFLVKWKKMKVPFVVFNTQIEDYKPLSYIGQDSYQSGVLAAKLFHYGHPDPCTVLLAHIDEDISNSAHLQSKEQGFRDYFEQNNLASEYHIRRTELQRRDYLAYMKQMDSIISNNADLKCIYVTTSKGYEIASYLEQRQIKGISVIGYDLVPRNIYYLNTGLISFVINQHPHGQGYRGIHALADYLVFKKKVQPVKYLPLDVVTKENMRYYLNEEG